MKCGWRSVENRFHCTSWWPRVLSCWLVIYRASRKQSHSTHWHTQQRLSRTTNQRTRQSTRRSHSLKHIYTTRRRLRWALEVRLSAPRSSNVRRRLARARQRQQWQTVLTQSHSHTRTSKHMHATRTLEAQGCHSCAENDTR